MKVIMRFVVFRWELVFMIVRKINGKRVVLVRWIIRCLVVII